MMCTSKVEIEMTDTLELHDDLEDFAKYLGVDYEDYYEMIYNLSDSEEPEIEYTVNI